MAVGIGIAGAGTVGGTLIRRLVDEREMVTARTGLDLEVRRVAVRDPSKARVFDLPSGIVTGDVMDLVSDLTVDLVVEVMGGLEPAGSLVLAALQAGKPVVTANKELIAARAPELVAAAAASGVPLLFEAAVGGGIPIIRPLSETLAGEQVDRVMGIVNGTTNFILTAMAEQGWSYEEALAEAQRLGYAEPDPEADVSGADAASKAAILAGLAFGVWVDPARVHREGIDGITVDDLAAASRLGYAIRLLAVAERIPAGVVARVHPAMVPLAHPLASIRGATNAIFITGASAGELLFAGPGAGGDPTATAVLGDVIDAARELLSGAQAAPRLAFGPGEVAGFEEVETRWCLRLEVQDSPGVLARIAGAFGDAGVSLRSVWQEGRGDRATLLLVTHAAPEAAQRRARSALEGLDVVAEVASVIRVEGEPG
ncbi:MAG: homoserine dehydrogenase [Acidimicrobiia bacterium]|nr:MAG: homoserine dehydrogenase [Acidimicrobiia bacterium]